MTYLKPVLAVAAALSLSACVPGATVTTVSTPGAEPVTVVDGPAIAPAAPEATAGTPGPDTLDGTWNLVASQCGDPASEGRLTIQGNKFTFPTSDCTVGTSEVQTNYTSVSLGCSGAANRQLNISIRPGVMRMTEGSTTLTYYRCM
ncbi:hypothetical protein [Paracoccus salipaludis]|uniref:hypothetical protein n=1 Tax=Paracoccus salipaludis TaxID=2032623 RepID=UPI001F0B1785|nr:hypothetical protein [Paracoccus salipaludis]